MDNFLSSAQCSPTFEQLRLGIRFKQAGLFEIQAELSQIKAGVELKYCVRYDWVIKHTRCYSARPT